MIKKQFDQGFTLIELLIAMAIGLVLMTAIYATYHNQQRAYVVQDQMAAMQQNARAAMHYLERDIQMAGFDSDPRDPESFDDTEPAIETATAGQFTFRLLGDGQCQADDNGTLKIVTYRVYASATTGSTLGRQCNDSPLPGTPDAIQPVAGSIEAIDFVYLGVNGNNLDSDGDGDLDGDDADVDVDGDGTGDIPAIDAIRMVEVTIVAIADREDSDYTNNNNYNNLQGQPVIANPGDHFRRFSLSSRIKCRNFGLAGAS